MKDKNSTNSNNITVTDNDHYQPSPASTPGEELFLVHLRRQRPEDDSSPVVGTPERKRSKSIGEELFEVHLARSKGVQDDMDIDPKGSRRRHSEKKKTIPEPKNRPTRTPQHQNTAGHIIITRSRAHSESAMSA